MSPRLRLDFRTWSPATASLVSGLGLLAMVVLMTAGYFGGVVPLITAGDAVKTATDISQSGLIYLAGVACIFLVTVIDVLAAVAWFALFKNVNRKLSAVAAWMRITFAGLFAIATSHLAYAYGVLDQPELALHAIESFRTIWLLSLGLFGLYLILIGYLELRSTFVPKVFGVLLVISGTGYIIDALGVVFVQGFNPMYGLFAIIGETPAIFWLLIKGPSSPSAKPTTSRKTPGPTCLRRAGRAARSAACSPSERKVVATEKRAHAPRKHLKPFVAFMRVRAGLVWWSG